MVHVVVAVVMTVTAAAAAVGEEVIDDVVQGDWIQTTPNLSCENDEFSLTSESHLTHE
jgi:hypothetical protein